jgi:phospholipid/cholesterol/gamma-HCH transport system ATP-binding protein
MILNKNSDPNILLSIQSVSKSFGGKRILENLNLNLHENENLVIMGKSGVGKSVLIKCIVGLVRPEKGEIIFDNIDLVTAPPSVLHEVRNNFGFLFQSGALYDSMSVKENLEFPLRRKNLKLSNKQINQLIDETLDDVGLRNSINLMPQDLSGGMRKRVGLARTLVLKPKIILYDEPTTGLDSVTGREILNLINTIKVKYSTSAIIITHDLECIKLNSDRIVLLYDGRAYANDTYVAMSNNSDPIIKQFFSNN